MGCRRAWTHASSPPSGRAKIAGDAASSEISIELVGGDYLTVTGVPWDGREKLACSGGSCDLPLPVTLGSKPDGH